MNYPNNKDLEEVVLSALLVEKGSYHKVSNILSDDLFYNDKYKAICKAIISLEESGDKVDLLTVFQWLSKNNYAKELEINAYDISNLTTKIASAAHIENHILLLKELQIKRELINIGKRIYETAQRDETDCFELLENSEISLSKITNNLNYNEFYSTSDMLIQLNKRNESIINNKGKLTGIDIGFDLFNQKLGGWQKGNLIIIAARPAMGKTALAGNMAINGALNGIRTAVFSLEMPVIDIWARCMSQITGIDLYDFTRNGLNEEKNKIVSNLTNKIIELPFWVDDTGNIPFMELKQKCRRLVKEKKVQVIYIDYLQLITYSAKSNFREQEISFISKGLKALAKELDIPIIALAQLSRSVEQRSDKIPLLSDLRESGSIEQDADVILFPWRGDYYGITEYDGMDIRGKAITIIAKNRNGSLDKIPLNFIESKTTFLDINKEINPF